MIRCQGESGWGGLSGRFSAKMSEYRLMKYSFSLAKYSSQEVGSDGGTSLNLASYWRSLADSDRDLSKSSKAFIQLRSGSGATILRVVLTFRQVDGVTSHSSTLSDPFPASFSTLLLKSSSTGARLGRTTLSCAGSIRIPSVAKNGMPKMASCSFNGATTNSAGC